MGAAVFLVAAALLALYVWGSLDVARGSSGAPPEAVSGVGSGGRSQPASAVESMQGVRVTVGPVVVEPAGAVPEPSVDADDATAMRRVAVYLKVRNVGGRVATFTPLDVALRDDKGEVYAAYNPEWSRSPALPGSVLEPDAQVEGWRVFEVPAAGFEYTLLYRSDAMDSAVEARLPCFRTAGGDR